MRGFVDLGLRGISNVIDMKPVTTTSESLLVSQCL